jgi:hypothetical protein
MTSPPSPGDLFPDLPAPDPVRRIRSSVARIRQVRGLIGAEGLPPSAARTLLDELTAALEACARGLEEGRGGSDHPGSGEAPPLFPPVSR